MITAQIISIVAFLISWIWWVTFIVGGICCILLQVIWCCRQGKIGLYISAGISFVAAITCIIAGIYMIIFWKDRPYCSVFQLLRDDYYMDGYRSEYSDCREGIWVVVAFGTALLWFATSGCIFYFVKSGRHTKWEEKLLQATAVDTATATTATTTAVATANAVTIPTTTTAIEMGTVQHHHHHHDNDDHQQQQQEQQQSATIAIATTSATAVAATSATAVAATSYVLPDIPNKIDNV